MPEMKRPLVYDETHQEHLPIEEGQAVSPAYIPVDTSVPNALQVGEEGLKVSADALVSDAADNQLKVQDNKLYVAPLKAPEADAEALVSDAEDNRLVVQDNRLYVAPVEVPDPAPGELVSADEGNLLGVGLDGKLAVKAENLPKQSVVSTDEANILREGTDGGAYLDGNDLLSNGDINLLTISEIDHKIQLTRKNVLENMTVVSEDEGNLIGVGSDGGVYMGKDELISEEDDVLTVDSHGKLVTELGMKYNTVTGELTLTGVDGEEVGSAIVPTSTSALRGVQFVRSMPSETGEAVEGDYFVDIAFKFDSQDAWDGGDAVKFTTTKGTAATQNVDYEMQSTVGTGVFPDHFKAVFMGKAVEQDITAGSPNTVDFPDGSRLILTWNTSTGTAINFQASFTPGIGIELGSFLRMAWLLADGSVSDVYIEMTDIYTAGNGIHIDDAGNISVVVSATGGLQNGPDGVGVKVDPDGGLQTSEEGTSIKVDPTGGLQTNENGTSIKVDETGGLQTNENGTSIKVDPEGGLQTGENGTSIKTDPASGLVTGPDGTGIDDTWLDNQVTDQIRNTELVTAGNGVEVTTTETGKKVAVVGSDSINSEAGGVSVDEEWLAQQITDKVKEDTSLVTADDSINVTPTGTGVQVGVDTGWLDQQITEQIKNDETLLVKGNGITLTPTATGREIAADAGTGVTVDTNGINVDQTWLNNRITDKVKGDATLITGGDGIDTTLTDTGTQVSVDEEWLSGKVTEQVRTDTGLIQAGNGITINVTDNGKTISANAGTGIVADTNGISVNEEWLAQQVTDKVKEDTSLVTAGNGVSVTPTETGVEVAVVGSDSVVSDGTGVKVNEDWLAGKVTEQVRTDADLVVAGNGLTETVGENGKTLNVNPGAGISVTGDAVTVDTAWLSEQLDTRVESGGFVTAGDGIDVTASEGKAEIAVDDTVVRTSGDQTIAGGKTFTNMVSFYQDIQLVGALEEGLDNSPQIDMPVNITKGTLPTGNVAAGIRVLDNADANFSLIQGFLGTNGAVSTEIVAYKNVASSEESSRISAVYPISGEPYGIAPTTPAAASSNEIVTVNYLKGANSGVVHTTGNEIITGRKTFSTSDLTISQTMAQNPDLFISWADYHRGDVPDSSYNMAVQFVDDRAGVAGKLGNLIYRNTTANESSISLVAVKTADDTGTETQLKLVYPATGDPYITAPNTRSTPVDNEIVTVDFLAKSESNLVHRTGNETINGLKTFAYSAINIQEPKYTINEDPESDQYWNIQFKDSTNTTLGDILFYHNTDANGGGSGISLRILNHDGTEVPSNRRSLQLTYDNSTGNTYVICPSTRTTPASNEIITYDFLQKFVEENGGGGASISDFNSVTNFVADSIGNTLPSGGTWLVLKTVSNYYAGTSSGYGGATFSIEPGGTRFRNTGDNTIYICAVRIA